MRGRRTRRRVAISTLIMALASFSLPVPSLAAHTKVPVGAPHVSTGGATHVLGTSALLTAAIDPNGYPTTYYFQWGPTTAYGFQTPVASAGNGTLKIKVGQMITGLLAGATYHFRVVATNEKAPPQIGKDRVFATKGSKLKFVLAKPAADVFGSPIILSGTLTGLGAANQRVALQASPYPYLEAFTTIGLPAVTDSAGRFSFRVANLTDSTQFRLTTLGALPVVSRSIEVPVAVRVNFSARSSGSSGLVRLYGTVFPAVRGARVYFQVDKDVRPGKNEATTRYEVQFSAPVKHGSASFSRFSMVVKLTNTGRYRAYVKVPAGPLASGYSTRTIELHAPPKTKK